MCNLHLITLCVLIRSDMILARSNLSVHNDQEHATRINLHCNIQYSFVQCDFGFIYLKMLLNVHYHFKVYNW